MNPKEITIPYRFLTSGSDALFNLTKEIKFFLSSKPSDLDLKHFSDYVRCNSRLSFDETEKLNRLLSVFIRLSKRK